MGTPGDRGLSSGAQRQLDLLLTAQPESAPWLGVLSRVLAEAADGPSGAPWDAVAATTTLRPERAPGTPLLAGAQMLIDDRLAQRWVQRVLTLAADVGSKAIGLRTAASGDSFDAVAFLEAAVNADGDDLDAIATSSNLDADALAAAAALAAMPLLQALRRRFESTIDPQWSEGYCPVCGGWPHLAEQRGLERARRLRCARCGGDWTQQGIRCPFCGVTGHAARAALVSEQDGEARKVETCARCRGYLKSVSTLRAWAGDEVSLVDLATVDLDLVALERDFTRPEPRLLDPGIRVIG